MAHPHELALPRITAAELSAKACTVVDVRSPAEFAEGHLPGALNLPLLEDEQRAEVGTAYHRDGSDSARVEAMRLISRSLPAYLELLRTLSARSECLAIMCWRGGDRSGNVVRLLQLVGVRALQLEGGYRAYRRWLLDGLAVWHPPGPVITLYGYTGSGKTAVLRAMRRLAPKWPGPRPAVVDLEGLALHRGSLLGGLNQPGRRSQKDFDALLWEELKALRGDYLILEGESAKIGHIFLPARVAEAIRGGIPVQLESTPEERAARILQEYAPKGWSVEEEADFAESLRRIASRAPAAASVVGTAFDEGRYEQAVQALLASYYDPLYHRSCVQEKAFAYTLESSGNPVRDAERLLRDLPALLV